MLEITGYEVVNGCKSQLKGKCKYVATIEQIDLLQDRAERIWNATRSDKNKVNVFIHFKNFGRHNPKSENLGKHDFKLEKWM